MDRVAVRGKHAPAASSNLPQHLTSFVGREAELRSLKGLLSSSRLVTLTGTGGAGKRPLGDGGAKGKLQPVAGRRLVDRDGRGGGRVRRGRRHPRAARPRAGPGRRRLVARGE